MLTAFLAAFVLFLREGLEAALIVSIVNGILHMIFGDPSEFGRQRREPAY